jgi:hypothetical protein
MKKYSYLIIIVLISSLVLAGCSLLSNIGQAPATGQSGITYLTKTVDPVLVLAARWDFNTITAGGTVADLSGNGNTGNVFGATLEDSGRTGYGNALSFNGNDYVMVTDSSLLEPSEITVEAWVKRLGSPGGAIYIVSKYLPDRYGGYSSYGLYTGSGGICFYIGYAGSWIGSPQAAAAAVWDGGWHHVAGTFDGSNINLYLDGTQVDGATATIQDIYYSGTGNLYIGAYTNISWLAFSGTIDEVRVWDSVLDAYQLDDMTPPTISSSNDVQTYLLNQVVAANGEAADDETGVASVTTNVANLDTSTAGSHSFTVTATDYAKNTDIKTVTYNVSKAIPIIIWSNPADIVYGTALSGTQLNATASVAGTFVYTPPAGTVLNAGSGQKLHVDFTPSDTANYDNASYEVTINVFYNWADFFPPVDILPMWNVAKAGSAIPVKFSLSGYQGPDIFATGYPKSSVITCDLAAPVDGIESTVTAGGSSLNYDATTDQYIYVWKTNKAWAGSCRQLVVELIDGTSHVANFTFK